MSRDAVYARFFFGVAVMVASAAAQTSAPGGKPQVSGDPAPVPGTPTSSTGTEASSRQACLPYSAELEIRSVRTLADGTHIVSPPEKITYYRDSDGRTRKETSVVDYPGQATSSSPIVFVNIVDPVLGIQYYFDLSHHNATRSPRNLRRASTGCVPPGASVSFLPDGQSAPPAGKETEVGTDTLARQYRSHTAQESLGTKTIGGVSAEGNRTTTIWPVGSMGNDRPITIVTEVWTSPEFGIEVLRTNSDPRTGDFTSKLTKFSRSNPDPALFKPPPDYRITGVGVPNQR